MQQSAFTIVADVDDHDALVAVLAGLSEDPAANAVLPLELLERAHFVAVVVRGGDRPILIVELNVDGSIEDTLADLVTVPELAAGVNEIFGCCRGWAGAGAAAYLADHVVRPLAHHVGNTGRDRRRILAEARLVDEIGDALDDAAETDALPSDPSALVGLVRTRGREVWPEASRDPGPDLSRRERIVRLLGLLPVVPAAAAIVVTFPYLLVKERLARRRWVRPAPVDPALAAELEAAEDRLGSIQNHMTSIVPIKAGAYRRLILRSVLLVIDRLARVVFTSGRLGSISTIHFAHWSIIDDGDSLLFVSNFDGSWESYLDDFIEKVAVGLTAVWSHCDGFPPTVALVKEGARHGPEFKAWARSSQLVTLVWYQAYPDLGVTDIDHASAVRRGLRATSSEEERRWLATL